ncbi:hypothetical protein PanWU01x14_130840 [Parasponia andersonii]|uniref:Uncharacterized protein n=1 Tax=Parasponia andersonii TaxID=3476 RepID=A0A2P5CQT8_PARAD|nr:hypothetical protein PanWU01x14_130840 [Parasponia andersonii]
METSGPMVNDRRIASFLIFLEFYLHKSSVVRAAAFSQVYERAKDVWRNFKHYFCLKAYILILEMIKRQFVHSFSVTHNSASQETIVSVMSDVM